MSTVHELANVTIPMPKELSKPNIFDSGTLLTDAEITELIASQLPAQFAGAVVSSWSVNQDNPDTLRVLIRQSGEE